jgi:hypothetical protein
MGGEMWRVGRRAEATEGEGRRGEWKGEGREGEARRDVEKELEKEKEK